MAYSLPLRGRSWDSGLELESQLQNTFTLPITAVMMKMPRLLFWNYRFFAGSHESSLVAQNVMLQVVTGPERVIFLLFNTAVKLLVTLLPLSNEVSVT